MRIIGRSVYTDISRHSLQFALHNPLVWIFGFFMAFTGSLGVFEIIGTVVQQMQYAAVRSSVPWYLSFSDGIFLLRSLSLPTQLWFGAMFFLLLFFGVAFCYLVGVSWVALVGASDALYHNKKMHIDALWNMGRQHAGVSLVLLIVKKSILYFFAFILGTGGVVFIQQPSFLSGILFFTAFTVLILVGVALSIVCWFILLYQVLEKKSFHESFRVGIRLFRRYWLVCLETSLVTLFGQILFLIASGIALLLFIVPALGLLFISTYAGVPLLYWVGATVGALSCLLLLSWLVSIYTIWYNTMWTSLFLHLTEKGIVARTFHWFSSHTHIRSLVRLRGVRQ